MGSFEWKEYQTTMSGNIAPTKRHVMMGMLRSSCPVDWPLLVKGCKPLFVVLVYKMGDKMCWYILLGKKEQDFNSKVLFNIYSVNMFHGS